MEQKIDSTRTADRRPLRLMVKSRVESRAVYVDLVDISEGGCKIRGSRGFANVGDRVTMRVAEIHAPIGHIAWVEDRYAGVAFEGKIHEAVLDHLDAMQVPDVAADKSDNPRNV
ncbi:MAG: PilZ domain-containing protein [Pseudomonadota bacterium]